jgi:hypothetical protein
VPGPKRRLHNATVRCRLPSVVICPQDSILRSVLAVICDEMAAIRVRGDPLFRLLWVSERTLTSGLFARSAKARSSRPHLSSSFEERSSDDVFEKRRGLRCCQRQADSYGDCAVFSRDATTPLLRCNSSDDEDEAEKYCLLAR